MNSKQTENAKYSCEKIEENKSYVWHTEGDTKTLIAVTDTLEKAHFLSTAANSFSLPSKPVGDVEEMDPADIAFDLWDKTNPAITSCMQKASYLVGACEMFKRLQRSAKSGYAAAPQKGMKWVKASKSPMKNGYYICWLGNEQGLIHYHSDTGWQNGFYNDKVTYYMPLIPPDESPSHSEAGDAIEFLDWVAKEDYKPGAQNEYWFKWNGIYVVDEPLTITQLYKRFKTQPPLNP